MRKDTWFMLGFFLGGVTGVLIHAHISGTLFAKPAGEVPSITAPSITADDWSNVRVARDLLFIARNSEADTLRFGEIVCEADGFSQSTRLIKRAKADSYNLFPVMGVVSDQEGIPPGLCGRIMRLGRIAFRDTSMWVVGDALYVSADIAGGMTNSAPKDTNVSCKAIGWVESASKTNGSIVVNI